MAYPVLKSFGNSLKRALVNPWMWVRLFLWYLLVVGVGFVLQRDLMYPAEKMIPQVFSQRVKLLAQEVSPGTVEHIDINDALIIHPPPGQKVVGTVIWYHGNGGSGIERAILADVFLRRGYRLVLAEYPGYAAREGAPSEQYIVDDAFDLYSTIVGKFPSEPVLLVGESLGSGVAVQVAARASNSKPSEKAISEVPARLVLITPYLSMRETAGRAMWLLPARLLVRDTYDSPRWLGYFSGPIAILVADKDEVVGADQGLELFILAERRGPATLFRLPDAGHNTWWYQISDRLWDQLIGVASAKVNH